MKNFGKQYRGKPVRSHGFSMIELLAVMAVILVVSAISTPSFMRAYQYYQVSNAATSMANVIKYTRYEAIRLNTPINCVIGPAPVGTIAWTDSDRDGVPVNDGVPENVERQVTFSTTVEPLARTHAACPRQPSPGRIRGPSPRGKCRPADSTW